jgi:hypothetical protein
MTASRRPAWSPARSAPVGGHILADPRAAPGATRWCIRAVPGRNLPLLWGGPSACRRRRLRTARGAPGAFASAANGRSSRSVLGLPGAIAARDGVLTDLVRRGG